LAKRADSAAIRPFFCLFFCLFSALDLPRDTVAVFGHLFPTGRYVTHLSFC
jgi:hypothetical protein